MTSLSPATVTEALSWRYATKKFDPARRIPEDTWAALKQALILAPSSYGLQPWKFIIVADPAVRERLAGLSWGQRQPVDCSHYVVFAIRKDFNESDVDRFIDRTVEVRGGTREGLKGYRDMMTGKVNGARKTGTLDVWTSRQLYIALGQFMTAAALLGVDTCPMEGLDPAGYDDVLGLAAQGLGTVVACAAGYRAADDKYASLKKVRFNASDVIATV